MKELTGLDGKERLYSAAEIFSQRMRDGFNPTPQQEKGQAIDSALHIIAAAIKIRSTEHSSKQARKVEQATAVCIKYLNHLGIDMPESVEKINSYFEPCRPRFYGDESTQLMRQCKTASLACIRVALINGADINKLRTGGGTALTVAVSENRHDVVELLLDKGAKVTIDDFKVLNRSQAETARLLIDHSNSFGAPELTQLIRAGLDDIAKKELNALPLSAIPYKFQNMMLFYAAMHNNIGLIKQLTAKGATPFNGRSAPLHEAIENNNIEIVHKLIQAGANVNRKRTLSTLAYAAEYLSPQTIRIMQLLIDNGANINERDVHGQSILDRMANNFSSSQPEWVRTEWERTPVDKDVFFKAMELLMDNGAKFSSNFLSNNWPKLIVNASHRLGTFPSTQKIGHPILIKILAQLKKRPFDEIRKDCKTDVIYSIAKALGVPYKKCMTIRSFDDLAKHKKIIVDCIETLPNKVKQIILRSVFDVEDSFLGKLFSCNTGFFGLRRNSSDTEASQRLAVMYETCVTGIDAALVADSNEAPRAEAVIAPTVQKAVAVIAPTVQKAVAVIAPTVKKALVAPNTATPSAPPAPAWMLEATTPSAPPAPEWMLMKESQEATPSDPPAPADTTKADSTTETETNPAPPAPPEPSAPTDTASAGRAALAAAALDKALPEAPSSALPTIGFFSTTKKRSDTPAAQQDEEDSNGLVHS